MPELPKAERRCPECQGVCIIKRANGSFDCPSPPEKCEVSSIWFYRDGRVKRVTRTGITPMKQTDYFEHKEKLRNRTAKRTGRFVVG